MPNYFDLFHVFVYCGRHRFNPQAKVTDTNPSQCLFTTPFAATTVCQLTAVSVFRCLLPQIAHYCYRCLSVSTSMEFMGHPLSSLSVKFHRSQSLAQSYSSFHHVYSWCHCISWASLLVPTPLRWWQANLWLVPTVSCTWSPTTSVYVIGWCTLLDAVQPSPAKHQQDGATML